MNNRASLLNALVLLQHLAGGGRSITDLGSLLCCSVPTTKRAITFGKKLGAKIEVAKVDGGYVYQLKNWKAISASVEDWSDRYKRIQEIEIRARIPNVLVKHHRK
jgi:hypothetical protein